MPQDDSSLSLYIRFELSLLVSSFRERLERILEGGNIPPQRPLACSPRFKTGKAARFARQTTSLSSSSTFFEGENIPPQRSTFFEGENIPPQRSLRSLLPLKNRHSSFVEVAPIRLLQKMSFGKYINSYTSS